MGSIAEGFERVLHLRKAALPGGDAAARVSGAVRRRISSPNRRLPDVTGSPFHFPARYRQSLELINKQVADV